MTGRTIPDGMRILRKKTLLEMIDIGHSTLDRWVALGTFPKPLKLSKRSIGWRESDVQAWIEQRANARS